MASWRSSPTSRLNWYVYASLPDGISPQDAHVKAKISVKAEASAALDLIVNKCNSAVAAISADVELKAKVAACTSAQKQLVAKAIADVIVDVNAVFVSLDAALLADAEIVSPALGPAALALCLPGAIGG